MSAPRLLDKKLISASLAQERKREIDSGIKLAKAVDALKEAREKEEHDLQEWRENTIKVIQSQIDFKQAENARLEAENKTRKEERMRLEGPIDLVQAWEEVHEIQSRNTSISDNLLSREIDVSKRENDTNDLQASFTEREFELKRRESSTEQALEHAETLREIAAQMNSEAELALSKANASKEEQDAYFKEKDMAVSQRERLITIREDEAAVDREEIINEKKLLADRQAMLERGFAELRRKQNGTNR